MLGVCWNVGRQLEINSQVPCQLQNASAYNNGWPATTEDPLGVVDPHGAYRPAKGIFVNEYAGADAGLSDAGCIISVPVSVLLREPRFQAIRWVPATCNLYYCMHLYVLLSCTVSELK